MVNPDDVSGRDLDAMVAQHVFGLVVEPRVNASTGERDVLYPLPSGDWVRVPFYTASLAASMLVELKLKDHGWKRVGEQSRPASSHDVRVVLVHRDGRSVAAAGPFETALCRAALKALAR